MSTPPPSRPRAGSDALGSSRAVGPSSQRTYRYVRVSLGAAVLLLGAGVLWQLASGGPLRSISAAYYTPVRSVFVGALFAVGVALVVLAGRSVRRFLLLLAGMTAPVIALVPAPIPSAELRALTGSGCPPGLTRCLPPGAAAEITAGMTAWLLAAAAVLIAAVVLARLDGPLTVGMRGRSSIAAVLLLGTAGWWALGRASFDLVAHYAAAALFFLLIAAVAGIHAAAVRAEGVAGPGSPRLYSGLYAGIAIVTAAVDLGLVLLLATGSGEALLGPSWLLIGEAVALALFAAFWILQTVENWNEIDATLR